MKTKRLSRVRTVAVIGSVAVIGGGAASAVAATSHRSGGHVTAVRSGLTPAGPGAPKPLASLSSAELAALAKARGAIAAAAPAIATPILDRAVSAGTITAAQRTAFLSSLSATSGPGSGRDGTWTGATGATGWSAAAASSGMTGSSGSSAPTPLDSAAQTVFESVRDAIQAKVASIATPVLDAEVAAGTLSSAQETTLLALLANGPLGHGGLGAPADGPAGGGPNMPAPPTPA